MTTNRKPPQSDYLSLRREPFIDTSDAERRYVLVHQKTGACGTEMVAEPEYIERENRRRVISGDPWRWEEMRGAA